MCLRHETIYDNLLWYGMAALGWIVLWYVGTIPYHHDSYSV